MIFMMKKLNITALMTLVFLAFTACDIRIGEEPCPDVDIRLFAEVFQNPDMEDPLHETEADFYSRIEHLQYYLYKNGMLVDMADTDVSGNSPSHLLQLTALRYGEYSLVIIGNCKKNRLAGDTQSCGSLQLGYPGWDDTEDFFYRHFEFTIDSEENKAYDLGLYRAHGFVSLAFENMPEFVDKISIRIEGVTCVRDIENKSFISTHNEDARINIAGNSTPIGNGYIVGTFPTMEGKNSPIYIDLYHKDLPDTPYYSECAGTDLKMVRNHLLALTMRFNDGKTDFDIEFDPKWDGSLFPESGGVEIN